MFSKQQVQEQAIASVESLTNKWEWNLSSIDIHSFERCIDYLIDSSAGKDGIPYSAYKACRTFAAKLFFWIYREMCNLGVTLFEFNFLMLHFIPKKASSPGSLRVTCQPQKTRPLGMKNTDSKLITSVSVRNLNKAASKMFASLKK
eukprot:6572716-Karenia_brevis.AAC.1